MTDTPHSDSEYELHLIVCCALGLDDEDHEDDELAEPLETALIQWANHRAEKLVVEAENALKLDLYGIQADELDEIVSRCEGKHIQQVVYSTYHKGFTRICFGCMQVDTTIKQSALTATKEEARGE